MQQQLTQPALVTQNIIDVKTEENSKVFYLVYANNIIVKATVVRYSQEQLKHEIAILNAIGLKHPNMSQSYAPLQPQKQIIGWIFYQYEEEIPLNVFLKKNRKTVSLSTKLHIMSQICSFIQYLHKRKIGYFIHIDNIFITKGL